MPAQSPEQQALFGIALSMKRGETPYSYSSEAAQLTKSMSEEKLEEMVSFPNPDAVTDIRLGMVIDPDLDGEPWWKHFTDIFGKGWWF